MIAYRVVHHVPGRIRVEVPSIKGLSLEELKRLSFVPIPGGIKDIQANPVTGSIVIKYEPSGINILKYLKDMASNEEINRIIRGNGK